MRKRYQKGSLKKRAGSWIAQYWEYGHRRSQKLGRISEMTKAKAQAELATIMAPINAKSGAISAEWTFGKFVSDIYFPFYERKWKHSTLMCNKHRINFHLCSEFAARLLDSFKRDELQDLLDRKADLKLSFSTVDHLRWDLSQIFEMAVADGIINRNPAKRLFTPRHSQRFEKRIMSIDEVKTVLSILDLRERLIVKLAILGGMRPGEIFALTWSNLSGSRAEVKQGLYRGKIDTPKSFHSIRTVALPDGLGLDVHAWKSISGTASPDAWVFPSEKMSTPVGKDNVWRRHIVPKLKAVGLEWISFQVMRRTHSSLMNDLKIDPKTVADQLGHGVDVNQNVYTLASLSRRKEAVNVLEFAVRAS
jgi:integrase